LKCLKKNFFAKKYQVKYTTYIGDSDSKTFKALLNAQSDGDIHVMIKRKECVDHIKKRMGNVLSF